MMRIVRGVLVAASFALLTACAVGPNYKRPAMDLSAAYKEQDGWKPSEPNDALDRGKWWEIYHDEVLNSLEAQINISNQTVLAAAANVEEAARGRETGPGGLLAAVSVNASRTRTVQGSAGGSIVTGTGGTTVISSTATKSTTSTITPAGVSRQLGDRPVGPHPPSQPKAIAPPCRQAKPRWPARGSPRRRSSPPTISSCGPRISCRSF